MDVEKESNDEKPACEDLCRLCANTDKQLIPIFQGEGIEHNIAEQISKYLPIITVTKIDKLPLQICYQCTSTLIAWHNFFEQCRVADNRLREILPVDVKLNPDDESYHDYTDDFHDDFEDQPAVEDQTAVKDQTEVKDQVAVSDNVQAEAVLTDATVSDTQPMETSDNEPVIVDTEISPAVTENLTDSRIGIGCHQPKRALNRYLCVMCPKMTQTKSGMLSHIAQVHSFMNLTAPEPEERSDEGSAAKRPKTEPAAEERLTVIKANLETKLAPRDLREAARRKKVALLESTVPSDLLMRSRVQCLQCPEVAPMWQCLACRKQFADKMFLDDHVHMMHVETASRGNGPLKMRMLGYCCEVCGRCFDELEYMIGHHVAMHPEAPPPAFEYLRRSTDWAMLCFGCLLYYRRTGKWFEQHRCVNWMDLEALERTKAVVEVEPRYLCDICAATFRFKCAYQYHRLMRHKGVTEVDWARLEPMEIPFVCEQCDHGFVRVADFQVHQCAPADEEVAPPAKPKVRCPQCPTELSTVKVLRRHIKMMHERSIPMPSRRNGRPSLRPDVPTIKCPFCEVMFTTTRDTLVHVKDVHNVELSSAYYCATCARDFSSNTKLRQHCAMYHSGPEDAKTVQAVCAEAECRRDDTVYYLCPLCSRKFLQPMDYFRHHQWHLAKREFTCDRCGHSAATREALRTHLRNAHAEPAEQRRFECDQCDSVLCSRFSLREHQAAMHGTERAYVCERCGKDFPTKVRLQTHLRNHLFGSHLSTSMRRYGCDLCGKDFKKKQTLRDHLAVHSGVRNEACPECGKLFFTKLATYFHRLNAHNVSRPHKCHLCEATFPLPSFLTRHLKKHAEREARAAWQAGEGAAAGSKAGKVESRGKRGRVERAQESSAEDGVEEEAKEEELVLEDNIREEVFVEEVTYSEAE